jgi:hypothetical protein
LSEVKNKFGIFSAGLYDIHLANWRKHFPRNQFLTIIFEEDIVDEKTRTLERIYRFLDVDSAFEPENVHKKYNTRYGHLHMRLRYHYPRLAGRLSRVLPDALLSLDVPEIPVYEYEREELRQIYRPHNRRLSEMIDRHVPWPL